MTGLGPWVCHSWAFRQLRTFLTYKAAQAGVVLIAVDPRNISRTCPVCAQVVGGANISPSAAVVGV